MGDNSLNLRVTKYGSKGDREYMEDMYTDFHHHNQIGNLNDLEWSYFGIFDGHGGPEAAKFAQQHLHHFITKQNNFFSNNDEDVLKAIRDGFLKTHYAMWKDLENWPKRSSGIQSTSGTTATVAIIMRCKIYIGHLGDTAIVLGYQKDGAGINKWKAKLLTKDHKPDCTEEKQRIEKLGGKVVNKYGVSRVIWHRPRSSQEGLGGTSNPSNEVPFLAVSRSLGDFWSYNSALDKFIVSPEPVVSVVYPDDKKRFQCLILGTDGLWSMLNPQEAIATVQETEIYNKSKKAESNNFSNDCLNPSKVLVIKALECWQKTEMLADNTSAITVLFDPPEFIRDKKLIKKINISQNENQFCELVNEEVRSQKSVRDTSSGRSTCIDEAEKKENNLPLLNTILSMRKQEENNETTTELNEVKVESGKPGLPLNNALKLFLAQNMYVMTPTSTQTRTENKNHVEDIICDTENKAVFPKSVPELQNINLDEKALKLKTHTNISSTLSVIRSKANMLCMPRILQESKRMLRSGTLLKILRSRNIYLSVSPKRIGKNRPRPLNSLLQKK